MKSALPVLAVLGALSSAALAAPNDGIVGTYARVEVGRGTLGLSGTASWPGSSDHDQAAKLFAGYRFEQGLGIELGYAALGSFSQHRRVGNASVIQTGKGRSVFGAAPAACPWARSLPCMAAWACRRARVSGTNQLPQAESPIGSKTSVLFGLGFEYRPRPNIALTLNYDNYGQLSNQVKASALLFGLHFTL